MKPVILVVDDEQAIRLFLEATLEDEGYEVITAASGDEALQQLRTGMPDMALLDLVLPDMSGLEVLKAAKKAVPHMPVVMITGYSEAETAVTAMKLDAYEYVTKPIQLDRLLKVVRSGLEESADARAQHKRATQSDLFREIEDFVPSGSPQMQEIYETIRKISGGRTTTVLIEGESGVGKDVIANLIHRTSARAEGPFLEINCAALPEQLLESELFGHEKGAFTDAVSQKLGLLELAHSGALFLDEIGEMSLPVQVKMLRVLEKMTFRRIGGLEDIAVDVRLIAATNSNLVQQVRAGAFREDLYYRLQVLQLRIPPLRARLEDIVPLAEYFLRTFNERFQKSFTGISTAAAEALQNYRWPGNIRELRNTIERTVLLENGHLLESHHLRFSEQAAESAGLTAELQEALEDPLPRDGVDLEELVARFESTLVRKAMREAGGNKSQAARLLGLNRDKLRYRLKQYEEGDA